MRKITTIEDLRGTISELEIKQAVEKMALKERFSALKESVKPINLIKNTFSEAAASPVVRESVLTSAIGLIVGYVAKRAVFGVAPSTVKNIAGTLLQMGVAGSAPTIKTIGTNLFKRFFNKQSEKKEVLDNVDQM